MYQTIPTTVNTAQKAKHRTNVKYMYIGLSHSDLASYSTIT